MKTEFTIRKVKCSADMVGHDIIIPAERDGYEAIKSLPYADRMICKITYKGRHNILRHDLFHSCLWLVANNLNKTKLEVEEQCKIDCRWIEGYAYYKDKNGHERCNIKTRSISFSEMTLQDADKFYSMSFDILAGYLGITTEELTTEAKLKMSGKYYCVACGARAVHRHHCFSQSKINIQKYGKKLIDRPFNRRWYCPGCHGSHANVLPDHLWDEQRFVKEAHRAGYEIDEVKK